MINRLSTLWECFVETMERFLALVLLVLQIHGGPGGRHDVRKKDLVEGPKGVKFLVKVNVSH